MGMRRGSMLLAAGLLGLAVASCGPPKVEPTRVTVALEASPDLNPDPAGRASPLVLRIYELKAAGRFEGADFFSIFEEESAALGQDLVGRDEVEVLPGKGLRFQKQLDPATRHLGVLAAFRELEKARWRAVAKVGEAKAQTLAVRLGATSVAVSLK
jgi:type VI secretion system protein VasD